MSCGAQQGVSQKTRSRSETTVGLLDCTGRVGGRLLVRSLVRSLQGAGGRGRHKLVLGPTWPIVGPWRPARGQLQEPGVAATSKWSGLRCCGWFGSQPHRRGRGRQPVVPAVSLPPFAYTRVRINIRFTFFKRMVPGTVRYRSTVRYRGSSNQS